MATVNVSGDARRVLGAMMDGDSGKRAPVIARELGISIVNARRCLDELADEGHVWNDRGVWRLRPKPSGDVERIAMNLAWWWRQTQSESLADPRNEASWWEQAARIAVKAAKP